MRSSVDEVRKGNEGSGETDGRAIECCNEDLRVSVKGVGNFEVVGYEIPKGLAANISSFCHCARGSNISATIGLISILIALKVA